MESASAVASQTVEGGPSVEELKALGEATLAKHHFNATLLTVTAVDWAPSGGDGVRYVGVYWGNSRAELGLDAVADTLTDLDAGIELHELKKFFKYLAKPSLQSIELIWSEAPSYQSEFWIKRVLPWKQATRNKKTTAQFRSVASGQITSLKHKKSPQKAESHLVLACEALFEGQAILRGFATNHFRPQARLLIADLKQRQLTKEQLMADVLERVKALEQEELALAVPLPDDLPADSLSAALVEARCDDLLR